ncbi:hypothetical protein KXR87_18060 [Yokenella regensburgei]|uniref:hypothetical protein n=1 Tax=Yokenella regensburgei TaxID=158877 RepID=UPI003F16486B
MQRKSVNVNEITLLYLEAGEGPVVLCCYGFPETPSTTFDGIGTKIPLRKPYAFYGAGRGVYIRHSRQQIP